MVIFNQVDITTYDPSPTLQFTHNPFALNLTIVKTDLVQYLSFLQKSTKDRGG